MSARDVVIVGAGAIGTAVAWRCAQRGLAVTVVDPDPDRGAWRTAAGMLAPTMVAGEPNAISGIRSKVVSTDVARTQSDGAVQNGLNETFIAGAPAAMRALIDELRGTDQALSRNANSRGASARRSSAESDGRPDAGVACSSGKDAHPQCELIAALSASAGPPAENRRAVLPPTPPAQLVQTHHQSPSESRP